MWQQAGAGGERTHDEAKGELVGQVTPGLNKASLSDLEDVWNGFAQSKNSLMPLIAQ